LFGQATRLWLLLSGNNYNFRLRLRQTTSIRSTHDAMPLNAVSSTSTASLMRHSFIYDVIRRRF